jgi:hypothetical protein
MSINISVLNFKFLVNFSCYDIDFTNSSFIRFIIKMKEKNVKKTKLKFVGVLLLQ